MQARDRNTNRPWGVLVLAFMLVTVTFVGMIELVVRVASIVPGVGDIIVFEPGLQPAGDGETRLLALRAGQAGCMLDVAAMRQTGGSLIMEERKPGRNPLFRVHWSGLRTSGDADNCGAAADLELRASDLQILALGAGGFGVATKRPGAVALWNTTTLAMP
jgi:hypothetical protein